MPTKRTRATRQRRSAPPSAAEWQWLTGEPQPDANSFYRNAQRHAATITRQRELLEGYGDLVPAARLERLRSDLDERQRRLERRGPGAEGE